MKRTECGVLPRVTVGTREMGIVGMAENVRCSWVRWDCCGGPGIDVPTAAAPLEMEPKAARPLRVWAFGDSRRACKH